MSIQTINTSTARDGFSRQTVIVVAFLIAAVFALAAIGANVDRTAPAPSFKQLAGGAEPGPFGLEDWHGNVRRTHQ